MPCYKPLTAYYARKINPKTGKRSLVFNIDQSLIPVQVKVSCGQCIGCRLDRSLQWAIRCVNEASLHPDNCFITLTFDDINLNKDQSLKVSDFQNFMKRLRKYIYPQKVRFFHCGEYGEKLKRPHHHACLFGIDFPDKKLLTISNENKIYTSEILKQLWPYGHHTIGDVTFDSAAYIARYVIKKINNKDLTKEQIYEQLKVMSNKELAQQYYKDKKQEYITMSRRPGIGSTWYQKYNKDIYPDGHCIHNGKPVKPPKFYDSQYELDNPLKFCILKNKRQQAAQNDPHNSQKRLSEREEFKKQLTNNKQRGYENDTKNLCNP